MFSLVLSMGDAIEVLKALVKEKTDTEIDTESASPYEVLYDDLVRCFVKHFTRLWFLKFSSPGMYIKSTDDNTGFMTSMYTALIKI